MFYKEVLSPILHSITTYGSRNAFCIDEEFYTYEQLGRQVQAIRSAVHSTKYNNPNVGLVINDDLKTYAAIIALWLEGAAYVPLHPNWPIERCLDICEQVKLDLILDSTKATRFEKKNVLQTDELPESDISLEPKQCVSDEELAYILFTSGSTGKPKGVQLCRRNLSSFVDSFSQIYEMTEEDRCLQAFDLSFDLSIMSYLIPLLKGACVYTVPLDVIKYSYIGGLIEDEKLTFALMAPSTIRYLRPYFDEIDCSSLKYSLFCGEALQAELVEEWSKCANNAIIDNVYGPTEDTIFCSTYRYVKEGLNKSYNGVLSIGKPMSNCQMEIFNDQKQVCPVGELGELCLAGDQLTIGYYNNATKNAESFFAQDSVRWYKSGDLCYKDQDGDIMYSGRMDHQAKIQGFRVELGEIEYHAREFLQDKNVICMAFDNKDGITEIAMFVESEEFPTDNVVAYMRTQMPSYMIPSRILFVPVFPLNSSDKIDKVSLKSMIN